MSFHSLRHFRFRLQELRYAFFYQTQQLFLIELIPQWNKQIAYHGSMKPYSIPLLIYYFWLYIYIYL